MMVKEDKPNSLYTFDMLKKDLKSISAPDMAVALRCRPDDLGCNTGYELVFTHPTRFKSINGFRELVN
jgi:hypothetical protein